MSELIWVEHNLETGEIIERPFTKEEIEQMKKDAEEGQKYKIVQ